MTMSRRIYVGNLPDDVRPEELEDIFGKYHHNRIDIKGGKEPGQPRFAFVEFDDGRDAEDAVSREDGSDLGGMRLRVELARGGRERFMDDRGPPPRYGRDQDDYRPRPRYDERYEDQGRRVGLGPSPFGPSRKTEYAVEVAGLDPAMSWQDLKDHFRDARLEVSHADVDRRGCGTVMFATEQDMEDALRLDGSEMRNSRGSCVLRLTAQAPRGRDERSRY